jgi:hypothetical protein
MNAQVNTCRETHVQTKVASVCDFFMSHKWAEEGLLHQTKVEKALNDFRDVNILATTKALKNLANEFTVDAQGITNAVALSLRAGEYAMHIKLAIQELLTATSEYQRWVKELQKVAQVVLALK